MGVVVFSASVDSILVHKMWNDQELSKSVAESIRQVQAFQLVRESKGTQATPSGRRPGKPTLTPGPDLAGNVWKAWKTEIAFD